jgi:hypothetical protein
MGDRRYFTIKDYLLGSLITLTMGIFIGFIIWENHIK